jgi:hypothetical protein
LWTNRYHGPANGNDGAIAAAVDSNGNVFVTGQSVSSAGDYDYATIKYSSAGTALWTNRYNGRGNTNDSAEALAVDGTGNLIVTGYSTGSAGINDYATIKYSGSGAPLWTNRYHGPSDGDDHAGAIAVDGSGNVFVTGLSRGSGSGYDYATIAYSGAGTALWTNRYDGGNGDDGALALAVDRDANVFATGSSTGTNGYYDYLMIKYSSAIPPSLTIARTTTNTVAVS